MKRIRWIAWFVVLALLAGAAAMAEDFAVSDENAKSFGKMLMKMRIAYEDPTLDNITAVYSALRPVADKNPDEYEIGLSIADQWAHVYCDEDYPLYLYHGDGLATELEAAEIPNSADHAFVVLGYALKDGEMADELRGRCDAAAAAAKAYPNAIVVCSGGATGENNPDQHTEAGLMKQYLTGVCGIDEGRVFIDEQATDTRENAVNTLAILRERNVKTMTIVTSVYHQRRGQALYNAMAALYKRAYGYEVSIVGNFNLDIAPENERLLRDGNIAVQQLGTMLGLPEEILEELDPRKAKPGEKPSELREAADEFVESLGGTWDAFLNMASEAGRAASDLWDDVSEGVDELIREKWPELRQSLEELGAYFTESVTPEIEAAWETLKESAADLGSHAQEEIEKAYEEVRAWLEESGADEEAREALDDLADAAGVGAEEVPAAE